jgi:EAL domain-containing protein (putative c-di-GMP-specific phosphodiesterase class I)
MEALLRWEYPQRGLLSTEEFIALAEATGLIVPIGQWVLEEVCRQALRWQQQYPEASPWVNVNISAKQFEQPGLAERVDAALRETGLHPQSLILEITESFLMEDAPHMVAAFEELRDLGVKIAIDDFGIGYLSLSCLERFPVDFLKIDRSVVNRLGQDKGNAAVLVSALVDLTRALGIVAVAEGVETAEQLKELREAECELGQGYYFWEPLPSREASDLLKSRQGP